MRLTPTIAITDAMLTTNVDETPPAAYSAIATYAEGDRASIMGGISNTTATIYESRIDANLGNDPASSPDEWKLLGTAYKVWTAGSYDQGAIVADVATHTLWECQVDGTTAGLTNAERWIKYGPTNRWAALDDKSATQTVWQDRISYTIAVTGRVDTVGLVNVAGTSVNVTVHDATGEVELYNEDFSLLSRAGVTNWYAWLFAPRRRARNIYITGLPRVSNPRITVTVTSNGPVAIGHCGVGWEYRPGYTELGGRIGITDFSEKTRDAYGTYQYDTDRGFSDRGQFNVELRPSDIGWVKDLLTDQKGKPMLIVGSELHKSAIYFGVAWDWEIQFNDPKPGNLSMTIEGL